MIGFSGGNGPIFGIAVGRHEFFNCLFIAGAFNNGPPIVLWMPASSESSDPRVISVGSLVDNIHGLVTSVAQVNKMTSYHVKCIVILLGT
jgi:hypothetical protein